MRRSWQQEALADASEIKIWKSEKKWRNKLVPSPSGGCSFTFHKNKGTDKNIQRTKPNLFGTRSQNYQRDLGFYKLINKTKSALKHKCNNDNLLPTKNFILMCSKVQRWLAQCEITQDISEVNNGIVLFSGILEDIWENRFWCTFPLCSKWS